MALEVRDMTGSEIERYQGASLAALPSEEVLTRIERMAGFMVKSTLVPERYRESEEHPEAKWDLINVGITLVQVGVPFNQQTVAQTWVMDGKVNFMAQLCLAIAKRYGYDATFADTAGGSYDDNGATIAIRKKSEAAQWRHYTYTIDMARKAGLLNQWVEEWKESQRGKRYPVRTTVAVDGVKVDNFDQLPEPARKAYDRGDVKRKDPWFNSRTQMLMARAATMALRIEAPEALLGVPDLAVADADFVDAEDFGPVERPTPPQPPAGVDPETGEVLGDDDDVVDAEVVEEPAEQGNETGPEAGADDGTGSKDSDERQLADDWDRAALRNAFTNLATDALKAEAQRQLAERGISLKNPDLTQEEMHEGFRLIKDLDRKYKAEQKAAAKAGGAPAAEVPAHQDPMFDGDDPGRDFE